MEILEFRTIGLIYPLPHIVTVEIVQVSPDKFRLQNIRITEDFGDENSFGFKDFCLFKDLSEEYTMEAIENEVNLILFA